MSQQAIELLCLPAVAAGALTSRRFVGHNLQAAGNDGNTLGVALSDAAANDAVSVCAVGTAVVEAGGAISAGDALSSDASGRAKVRATGPTVGRALQAAAAAGDFIEVLLIAN